MKLKEYQNNLKLMEKLLEQIREEGIFADNIGGVARLSVTIAREWTEDHTRRINRGVGDFVRLASLRNIDLDTLALLRLADKCGVDIIDDLLEALPKAHPVYAMDMQQPVEYFLEGELK